MFLEAQTEAMTKLAESKTECSRKHHTITTGIEAVQEEIRKTTEWNMQSQEAQVLKMDGMGCKIAAITDLLAQREQRNRNSRHVCAKPNHEYHFAQDQTNS